MFIVEYLDFESFTGAFASLLVRSIFNINPLFLHPEQVTLANSLRFEQKA